MELPASTERASAHASTKYSPKAADGTAERILRLAVVLLLASAPSVDARAEEPGPPGRERSTTTKLLESGAELLQEDAPVEQLSLYLVGFHPMKEDPSHQMEAHHYCNQVNEEFAQCVLFDGGGEAARLNGIEYIISERLFETLSLEEKKYWHPHNYEILSGQLVAPGIPDAAEHAAMAAKMNSYGKTWHTWKGGHGGPGDALPLGDPQLAWSFNRDGEAAPGLVAERDERLGLRTGDAREKRQDLVAAARPQCGVDVLRARFPGETAPIPGASARTGGCPEEGTPTTGR